MKYYEFLDLVKVKISQLTDCLDRPIVIYSSLYPFLSHFENKNKDTVNELLNSILNVLENRLILMPTFTNGFKNGVCNLDLEHSLSGVLTECFRLRKDVDRTLSAFFSFAVFGNHKDQIMNLKPKYAWGEGSLYEWMEHNNVFFLMLGLDPTECSFIHRIEWLLRDKINFRYIKKFSGKLIRNDDVIEINENLFVRRLNPPIRNNFRNLRPYLDKSNIKKSNINGIPISLFNSQDILDYLLPTISKNPKIILSNDQ